MRKILVVLFVLGIFVLGRSESFTRQKGLEEVGEGEVCDTLREVFEKDKKVLGGGVF